MTEYTIAAATWLQLGGALYGTGCDTALQPKVLPAKKHYALRDLKCVPPVQQPCFSACLGPVPPRPRNAPEDPGSLPARAQRLVRGYRSRRCNSGIVPVGSLVKGASRYSARCLCFRLIPVALLSYHPYSPFPVMQKRSQLRPQLVPSHQQQARTCTSGSGLTQSSPVCIRLLYRTPSVTRNAAFMHASECGCEARTNAAHMRRAAQLCIGT